MSCNCTSSFVWCQRYFYRVILHLCFYSTREAQSGNLAAVSPQGQDTEDVVSYTPHTIGVSSLYAVVDFLVNKYIRYVGNCLTWCLLHWYIYVVFVDTGTSMWCLYTLVHANILFPFIFPDLVFLFNLVSFTLGCYRT